MTLQRTLTLLCLGTAMAGALTFALPDHAQAQARASQTESRLLRLENEIQTLSRAIYRGERPVQTPNYNTNAANSGNSNAEYATLSRRLTSLENELRRLIGQIEQQGHQIRQLQSQQAASTTNTTTQNTPQITMNAAPSTATPVTQAAPNQLGTLVQSQSGTQNATINGVDMDASKLYDTAFAALQQGDYTQAESHFSKFLNLHGDSPLAANAQYWLSETQFIRNDYPAAARNFALGYQTYPASPKAPDNLLKLGLSLGQLGQKQEACVTFDELFQKYPSAARSLLDRAMAEKKTLNCD